MRALPLVMLMAVTACAAPTDAPSLAPRPAEAIDPRVPVPEGNLPSTVSPGLRDQLDALLAQAASGDEAFGPLAEHARQLAADAGAKESESWVVAQQALSAAVAARAPVATAVANIDALGGQRIQATGGVGRADLKAIDAAAARVAEIDRQEAALIAEIQARLAR
jgi:hypothetical protein